MNDFFADRFEDFLIYDSMFSNFVYEAFDYQALGLLLVILPIVALFVFYKVVDPQPVKRWKWLVGIILNAVLVFFAAYYWLYSNSMYISIQNDEVSDMSAIGFTLQLSGWTVAYSLIPAFLFSWIWSRTVSINNAKNPL